MSREMVVKDSASLTNEVGGTRNTAPRALVKAAVGETSLSVDHSGVVKIVEKS